MEKTIYAPLFNLDIVLRSGQVFGWKKDGEWYVGEIYGNIVKLKQENEKLKYSIIYSKEKNDKLLKNKIKKYFSLDISKKRMEKIYNELRKDPILKKAIEEFYGLRLIRQDPWYCTISFMCSSFSNIPKIEKNIQNIKMRYGKKVRKDIFLFPTIEELNKADKKGLKLCGVGFREKYFYKIGEKLSYRFLKKIEKMDYEDAKKELMKINGIGEKVADCILLFSYGKGESFPIDVWIKKIMLRLYGKEIRKFLKDKIKKKTIGYKEIQEFARYKWKENAGLAQQFLYMYARKHRIK